MCEEFGRRQFDGDGLAFCVGRVRLKQGHHDACYEYQQRNLISMDQRISHRLEQGDRKRKQQHAGDAGPLHGFDETVHGVIGPYRTPEPDVA